MARSTRLVILIKNLYPLWGRKRFLLPITYFPTNLVYPFTLRVSQPSFGLMEKLIYFKIDRERTLVCLRCKSKTAWVWWKIVTWLWVSERETIWANRSLQKNPATVIEISWRDPNWCLVGSLWYAGLVVLFLSSFVRDGQLEGLL